MKKLCVILAMTVSLTLGGCSTFQKERDLELYIVGAGLSFILAKHVCRKSDFADQCAAAAALAFIVWY